MQRKTAPLEKVSRRELACYYMTAKESLIAAGYATEIDWQEDLTLNGWDESEFLKEAAWVVLSSGFRESIVRNRFPAIAAAFFGWVSAEEIVAQRVNCRANALKVFNNQKKVGAIIAIAGIVARRGFPAIREGVRSRGPEYLQELPFIGPITSYHLAKNLGFKLVKPDRHLIHITEQMGYASPDQMCRTIADVVGDELSVIDIVLWRYGTMRAAGVKAA